MPHSKSGSGPDSWSLAPYVGGSALRAASTGEGRPEVGPGVASRWLSNLGRETPTALHFGRLITPAWPPGKLVGRVDLDTCKTVECCICVRSLCERGGNPGEG